MRILLVVKSTPQNCGDVLRQHLWRIRLIQCLELRSQAHPQGEASLQLSCVEQFVSSGDKSPVHVAQLCIVEPNA